MATALESDDWTTQEWLHFLKSVPGPLTAEQMTQLDEAFGFTEAGNSEVAHQWLLTAIRNRYEPAYLRLENVSGWDRPAQAHQAALRRAGEDAGGPRSCRGDLRARPARLSPESPSPRSTKWCAHKLPRVRRLRHLPAGIFPCHYKEHFPRPAVTSVVATGRGAPTRKPSLSASRGLGGSARSSPTEARRRGGGKPKSIRAL